MIPATLAELPKLAEYAGPGAQFYVKEISRLEQWRKGIPHLPHNRVWCGFNSFNIPDPEADHSLLSLQGAGDLMILSHFIHHIGNIAHIGCYVPYASLISPTFHTLPILRSGATDALLGQIRHKYSYVSNHPMVLQFLRNDALAEGWDMYDWFGLMLGIAPGPERWVNLQWQQDPYPMLPSPVVCVHVAASTAARSVPLLIVHLMEEFGPDVRFMLLGGSESSMLPVAEEDNLSGKTTYHGTYRLLQDPMVKAVIAVESLVMHLAVVARPDLPVLGVYNHTPVTWRGPDRPGVTRIRVGNYVDKSTYKEVYLWLRALRSESTW